MSTYFYKEWPQADRLSQQLINDEQPELIIISEHWPLDVIAETPEGQKILCLLQQARTFWQQQPVYACPFFKGKLLVIRPDVYEQWSAYNRCISSAVKPQPAKLKPWLTIPEQIPVQSVVVIGAGIAGASTAFALAQRNIAVTVIEQNEIATAGSGNHQGLLYAKISPNPTAQTELLLSGYAYSLSLLKLTDAPRLDCGVLHLDFSADEQFRNQQLASKRPDSQLYQSVTSAQASKIAGIDLPNGGLWWPFGVTANPRSVVQVLLAHPLINVLTHSQVQQLAHNGDCWQVTYLREGVEEVIHSSHIVICAGAQSNQLDPIVGWPLQVIRGQTTTANPGDYAEGLKCALSGKSYITPVWQDKMCFGATFHPNNNDDTLTLSDEQINWQHLTEWLPALANDLQQTTKPQGHAALRCDAYDHLPVVGPIGDTKSMLDVYAKLKHDKNYPVTTPCPWLPGAFVNTAHGSRGLATAPLCAEAIAAAILGLPSPLSAKLQQALHPNRLLIRTLTHYRHFK